jgi:hypothetical protein
MKIFMRGMSMRNLLSDKKMNENGLSLVEVLASIVILTLLLTTFLMLFLQSARTNKVSVDIIDSTYTAQIVMEKMYDLSLKTNYSGREVAIIDQLNYTDKGIDDKGWTVFENDENPVELIKVRLKKGNGNMDRIIVEVFDKPEIVPRAKMQNVLVWGE